LHITNIILILIVIILIIIVSITYVTVINNNVGSDILSALSCTTDQIVKWNATGTETWECATEQMKVYTKDLTSYDFFFETPNNDLVFQGVGDCDDGDQILNVIHQSEPGIVGTEAIVDRWIDFSDGAVSVVIDTYLSIPTENVRGILVCLDLTP